MKSYVIATILAACLSGAAAFADPQANASTAAEVMASYQKIHAALAADSTSGVAVAAAAIVDQAEPRGAGGVAEQAQKALVAAAGKMKGGELAVLRAQFRDLSKTMAAYLDTLGAGGAQLYFCSMADGYWLQPARDAGVRNPYLGSSMLACGEKVALVKG